MPNGVGGRPPFRPAEGAVVNRPGRETPAAPASPRKNRNMERAPREARGNLLGGSPGRSADAPPIPSPVTRPARSSREGEEDDAPYRPDIPGGNLARHDRPGPGPGG